MRRGVFHPNLLKEARFPANGVSFMAEMWKFVAALWSERICLQCMWN